MSGLPNVFAKDMCCSPRAEDIVIRGMVGVTARVVVDLISADKSWHGLRSGEGTWSCGS